MSFRYPNGSFIKPGFSSLPSPSPIYLTYLYSWGRNDSGQLGLGNRTDYSSPKQVGSLTDWASVGSGLDHTAAIKTDGTLWSWGYNFYGALGLGNTTNYSSPKQVGSLTNWKSVICGNQTIAIKTDGTLWVWGFNNFGQLGLGNTTNYSSPKQVGSLTNWLQVSTGYSFVGAVKTDGTLWMWGKNNFGQLGFNNTTNYSSPKQVGSLTNWAKVGCGYESTVAIKTDGTVWTWGQGGFGALGLNNTVNYSSPKQVGSLTNWTTKMSMSFYNPLIIKTDGTLWSWGYNALGTLGLGNITTYSSPKQIGALTTWVSVNEQQGAYAIFAIRNNGTLWAWGRNQFGQLGIGNTNNVSSPTQVGSLTTWLKVSSGGYASFGLPY